MITRFGSSVLKDQCRRGPCGDDAPAPNETLGSVAHKAGLRKQFSLSHYTNRGACVPFVLQEEM